MTRRAEFNILIQVQQSLLRLSIERKLIQLINRKVNAFLQAHSNMMDLINEYQQYQNAGVYEEGEDEDEYTEEYQH